MNNMTKFCIVLYGLKKKNFEDTRILLQKAVIVTMHFEGFDQNLILKYVHGMGEITYGTTDRKLVAQLNRAMQDADWYVHDSLYNQVFQPEISQTLNDGPVGTDHWKNCSLA